MLKRRARRLEERKKVWDELEGKEGKSAEVAKEHNKNLSTIQTDQENQASPHSKTKHLLEHKHHQGFTEDPSPISEAARMGIKTRNGKLTEGTEDSSSKGNTSTGTPSVPSFRLADAGEPNPQDAISNAAAAADTPSATHTSDVTPTDLHKVQGLGSSDDPAPEPRVGKPASAAAASIFG